VRRSSTWPPVTSSVCLLAGLFLACSPANEEPAADATTAQLLEWAETRVAHGELDQATTGYRRALHRDSLDVSALLGLAQVYELAERNEAADRYRRRAFHVRYQQGLNWISAGVPDSARAGLEAAILIMPMHPLAHLRLGELERDAGQINAAIAHFERAVEANPHFAESLVLLGQAYLAGRRPVDAQGAFKLAIEANINAIDAYLGLGQIFSDQQEWAAAVSEFEKALLINPKAGPAIEGLDRARSHFRARRPR